jgi:hypothetical protein
MLLAVKLPWTNPWLRANWRPRTIPATVFALTVDVHQRGLTETTSNSEQPSKYNRTIFNSRRLADSISKRKPIGPAMQEYRRLIKFPSSCSIRDSLTSSESLVDFTKIKNSTSTRWHISFRTSSDSSIIDFSSNSETGTT